MFKHNQGIARYFFYAYCINGYLHKVILAEFLPIYWIIRVFIVLYKANLCFLCTNCIRLWDVCNK